MFNHTFLGICIPISGNLYIWNTMANITASISTYVTVLEGNINMKSPTRYLLPWKPHLMANIKHPTKQT